MERDGDLWGDIGGLDLVSVIDSGAEVATFINKSPSGNSLVFATPVEIDRTHLRIVVPLEGMQLG